VSCLWLPNRFPPFFPNPHVGNFSLSPLSLRLFNPLPCFPPIVCDPQQPPFMLPSSPFLQPSFLSFPKICSPTYSRVIPSPPRPSQLLSLVLIYFHSLERRTRFCLLSDVPTSTPHSLQAAQAARPPHDACFYVPSSPGVSFPPALTKMGKIRYHFPPPTTLSLPLRFVRHSQSNLEPNLTLPNPSTQLHIAWRMLFPHPPFRALPSQSLLQIFSPGRCDLL